MQKEQFKIRVRGWIRCGEWELDDEKESFVMIDSDSLAFEKFAPLCHLLEDKEDEAYFMLSTGLKDKHNTEVFREDIVQHKDGRKWRVVWDDHGAGFMFEFIQKTDKEKFDGRIGPGRHRVQEYLLKELTVIGNSFQNPEL